MLRPAAIPGVIPHFMFGVARYDGAALETRLRSFGLDPGKDLDSFHVTDPDGLDVQVGDKDLGPDPASRSRSRYARIRLSRRRAGASRPR